MLPPLVSLTLVAFLLWLLIRSGIASRLAVDLPNHRSLHANAIPRIGGLAMVPAIFLSWLTVPQHDVLPMLLMLTLGALSYIDDRSDLPVVYRLSAQVVVSTLFASLRLDLSSAIVLAALWILWCTNLYNFMDGADGLAGGMGVFGFTTLGAVAALLGNSAFSLSCLCVSAAGLGFLLFNFPPAKTFMGDAGSISLGFLMGVLGLQGWHTGLWPLWFPMLVFSPFIIDATATLLKRAARLEKVWVAHRDHYYQRLVRMGWSHRRLALSEYALMAACGASALVLLRCGKEIQYAGLAVWAIIYAVLMIKIDSCWKRFSATPS